MTQPLFPRPIAHRGLHDRAAGVIENTRTAFDAAIEGNFAIECDLQLTSDGIPIVFHDRKLTRLTGAEGVVYERTAAEMQRLTLLDSAAADTPQTFKEFLAQVDGRTQLQIELKPQIDDASRQQLAKAAADALKTYQGPATVESFDPRLISLVRDAGFSGPRGIILHNFELEANHGDRSPEERYILTHLLHWLETRFDFISCDHEALDLPAIAFWRALGKPVTAWTLKSMVEFKAVPPHFDQIVFEGFNPDSASA
ncbi:MAG: glycerophosphodiester phosphodiesterase [Devosia sp.]|uniref:glycerophosphodiester phosphodiesterase family protein n=1 Tax=Devosia sp. TaxID=1871048 RepID=UPI0024C93A8C|nr:glycerophosphodiester phosphodiesterase family protein [Devosia sp.]UYO00404.1 MAG: glycerophosphodiester phosphodiesterase [Devosia sp.]